MQQHAVVRVQWRPPCSVPMARVFSWQSATEDRARERRLARVGRELRGCSVLVEVAMHARRLAKGVLTGRSDERPPRASALLASARGAARRGAARARVRPGAATPSARGSKRVLRALGKAEVEHARWREPPLVVVRVVVEPLAARQHRALARGALADRGAAHVAHLTASGEWAIHLHGLRNEAGVVGQAAAFLVVTFDREPWW